MQIKIYYHHTDCGGVVYYGKYLEFLEEARTEFLSERGIDIGELIKAGVYFVVARQDIDYKYPVLYGDTINIETRLTRITAAKLEFYYEIKNQNGKILTFANTALVCVDKDFKPNPIPDTVKLKLSL